MFEAENFQGPASATVGQRVTAEVTIRNSGATSGEVQVEYRIDGRFVASKPVTVDAGASRNVSLTGDVPNVASGERTQGIHLDGSGTAAASSTIVINPSAATFTVRSISAFPSEGRVGDAVSITATVANTGDTTGTATFQYRIGGEVAGRRQDLELGPRSEATITIDGSVPSLPGGKYVQGVFVGSSNDGVTANFTLISDPASFQIETFEAPARAVGGSAVSATARVRNTGGARGTGRFQYHIDDVRIATVEQALDPGEAKTLTFTGTVPDKPAGIYQQRVTDTATGRGRSLSIRLDEDPAAKFAISRLRAPTEVEAGSPITVTADVTNTGTSRAQTPIEYRIDGNRLGRQTVDLRAGQTTRLTFEATVPDLTRGTYPHGVFVDRTNRGQTTSLTVAPRARVTVTGLIATREATPGDRVTAFAIIRNLSNRRIVRQPEYRIGSRVIASREVELAGEETRGISLDGKVPEISLGNYTHGVYVDGERSTGTLAIRARPEPRAAFEISSFEGASGGVSGESVAAAATVRNTGDARGSTTVEYRIDERVVASSDVTLEAGSERRVEVEGTVPDLEPGDYRHGMFIAGTALGADRRFTVRMGEPQFGVANVRAPASGTAGGSITVEATISNTGSGPGETEVQYRFDGDTLDTETVDLPAGGEREVTFEATVPDVGAGPYSHGVFVGDSDRGQSTSFVVEATPTETEDDGAGFGVVGALGGAGGLGYLLKRRLDGDGSDSPDDRDLEESDAPGE